MPSTRAREIDVFRGIAILMVIGFHYLGRWAAPRSATTLYPYGNTFAGNTIINHEHLGVDFFFIISGFVIALTLESCRSPVEFAIRRAARLLPAMIVCSLLTLLIVKAFSDVPEFQRQASFWNLLPSWTFTQPEVWAKFFPVTDHVDGAYWSLVVEAKFYFWAAVIYFTQRQHFTRNMFLFCVATSVLFIAGETLRIKPLQSLEFHVLFGRFAMMFAAGVVFYQLYKRPTDLAKLAPYLAACVALELIEVALVPREHDEFIATALFKLMFFLAFLFVALGWRAPPSATIDVLARIGLVSYPLYLLHQNIGVSLIVKSGKLDSPLAVVAAFIAICIGMVLVSAWLHRLVEEPGKTWMLSALRSWQVR